MGVEIKLKIHVSLSSFCLLVKVCELFGLLCRRQQKRVHQYLRYLCTLYICIKFQSKPLPLISLGHTHQLPASHRGDTQRQNRRRISSSPPPVLRE